MSTLVSTSPVAVPAGPGQGQPQAKPLAPVFYPAMCVNLLIRFDEAYLVDGSKLPQAKTPSDLANQQATAIVSGSTQADNLSQVLNIVPKSASVELPGYRQAGRFSLTFAWQDLPIDPRAVRAMAVDIFAAAIDPANFAAGMAAPGSGVRPSLFQPNGAFGFADPDHLLITGPVDEINTEFTSSGSELKLDGRDQRGILLDSPIQAAALAKLDLTLPIDRLVQAIADLHPRQGINPRTGKKWFQVDPSDPSEWPKGIVPAPATVDNVTAFRVGVANGKATQTPQGQPQKLNFWDVITNYCYLVGGVPYFTNYTIKVRPAHSIFDLTAAGQAGSKVQAPFAGGKPRTIQTDGGPSTFSVRRLVYGRDIEEMKLARKCGGTQTPVVTVVSFDSSNTSRGKGKLLTATYPSKSTVGPGASAGLAATASAVSAAQARQAGAKKIKQAKDFDAAKRTAVGPLGQSSELQEIRLSVPGVKSMDQLVEIARNLYEEIGRQEIGGSCSTKDLASLGGDNSDPDLLRLRPGDAVQMLVDGRALSSRLPGTAPLSDMARMPFAEAVAAIKDRLGLTDDNLARALVSAQKGAAQQFSTFFRVSNVKYGWSARGIALDFDFQNYVEVRSQVGG